MKTALIIIDIQNDYFPGGANPLFEAESAGRNANLLLNKFREKHLPVVHIQHISVRPGSTFFLPNTSGSEFYHTNLPQPEEKIFIKHTPNSFHKTGLLDYLQKIEINRLIVCGMMTHLCVDSTVRAAKDLGFEIILIEDACATKDLNIKGKQVKAVDVHNAFVAALTPFYSKVMHTIEFLNDSEIFD